MSSACSIILFAIRTKNEYIKILFGILNCVIFKRIFFLIYLFCLCLCVCREIHMKQISNPAFHGHVIRYFRLLTIFNPLIKTQCWWWSDLKTIAIIKLKTYTEIIFFIYIYRLIAVTSDALQLSGSDLAAKINMSYLITRYFFTPKASICVHIFIVAQTR